jgi:uncharacterized protein
METLWIAIGAICIITGIAGSILPVLPGPPISFAGMLLLQLTNNPPFTTNQLIFWGVVVAAVTLLDYFIPVWGTKKFGGSKYGTWGSTIGLIFGLFLGPAGIIAGPFLGALIGELIGGKDSQSALKSAFGSFIGFLAGTVVKLVTTIIMAFLFFKAIL